MMFSPSTSDFSCQRYSTNASCLFVHLPPSTAIDSVIEKCVKNTRNY
jgi:hypothetical protein